MFTKMFSTKGHITHCQSPKQDFDGGIIKLNNQTSSWEEVLRFFVDSSSNKAKPESSLKNHKQCNPEEHTQALQIGEALTPRYLAKKRPTTDPNMNPKPVTKLTEKLAAETVHGHAPIHSQSANPMTNSGPYMG